MTTLKLVARLLVVLLLAACGGGSVDDSTSEHAQSQGQTPAMKRLSVTVGVDTSRLDQTLTGFFYPTGTAAYSFSAWWLAKDPDYFPGEYHLGLDIMRGYGLPVYAIADGIVKRVSPPSSGWGANNCALAIEHKTGSGEVFVAIYGHLLCSSVIGERQSVSAGQPIGTVGDWPPVGSAGDHLHFGIHPGPYSTIAKSQWGRQIINGNWPEGSSSCTRSCLNTMTDPIAFIQTHSAYNPSTDEQVSCQGHACWKPVNGSCESATAWYRMPTQPFIQQGQPFVLPAGKEICDEVAVIVQNITKASNPQNRTPNEHGWQAWLRAALRFFGLPLTASAAELQSLNTYGTLNTVYVLEGRIVAGNASKLKYGTGPGYALAPEDAVIRGQPDFITSSVKLFDSQGEESYSYFNTASFRIHAIIENEGDADWAGKQDDMYVRAYLSRGYKRDSSSEWKRIGTNQIKKGNIKVGDHKSEYFDVDLKTLSAGLPLTLGIWNVVVCADRKKDEDNGIGEVDEKHESNNCSSEAVITVEQDSSYVQPLPDLIITYIEIDPWPDQSIQKNKEHHPTMRIKNIGSGPVTTPIRSAYYLKGPSTGEVWKLIANDGTESSLLPPGAEVTETIASGYKVSKKGVHYLKACADYQESQSEKDEENNCLVSGAIVVK